MQGKSDTLNCDDCEFKTSSISLLTKHNETIHQNPTIMRTRFSCDKCGFKTTSNVVLKTHIECNHKQKEAKPSKRKACNICDKRFNKETNLKEHMNKQHNVKITN